jgi:hypothetical protein
MVVSIQPEGIPGIQRYLEDAPDVARRAASLAINQTASRKGLSMVRDLMREQIAFPRGYLEDPERLSVTQKATPQNLQAAITGRHQPTSLARFATSGSPAVRNAPVRVRVNPGRTVTLDRAFLLRLRGAVDSFNLGLAVRLRPGETIENKNFMVKSMGAGSGVYLLYGPSVTQVFRDVAVDVAPALMDEVETEFLRQFIRLSK